MATPTSPVHDAATRFYTLLEAAHESSVTEAEQLLPIAQRRVDECRQILAELRTLEARAAGELERWEQTAASLARSIDPDSPAATDGLRGVAIADTAADVCTAAGKTAAIHYRDILALVLEAGYRIPTENPQASLLEALGRSRRWSAIGGRSGLWLVAA